MKMYRTLKLTLKGNEITKPFCDVSYNHPMFCHIRFIYENGITGGCVNQNYCPDNPVTRAQMAVFIIMTLVAASDLTPDFSYPTTPYFTDVPSTHWAFKFIQKAKYENITGGCAVSPPKYCPDDLVSRAQMAVFLTRMVEIRKNITVCP